MIKQTIIETETVNVTNHIKKGLQNFREKYGVDPETILISPELYYVLEAEEPEELETRESQLVHDNNIYRYFQNIKMDYKNSSPVNKILFRKETVTE